MDLLPLLLAPSNPQLAAALRDPMLMQKIAQDPNYLQKLVLQQSNVTPQQPALVGTQPSEEAAPALVPPKEMLLRLYDEFATQDDGKQLAAYLTKFARFVQSKVDKAPGSNG
jgi:hypothetical protein